MKKLTWAMCLAGLITGSAQAALFGESDEAIAIRGLRQQVETQQAAQEQLNTSLQAENVQLKERVARLEAQLKNQRLLDMVTQMDSLAAEMAKIRGQLEVINFNLENTQKRQKDLYVDLDNRLRLLEQGGSLKMAEALPKADKGEDAAVFESAYNLFRSGNYKNAATAFENYLKQYPTGAKATESQFWLGQAQAAQRDYKAAMTSLQKVVDTWPDHPRSADALRTIANLQLEQGDKKAARKTLKQVVDKYPNTDAASRANQQLNSLK